jgi:hypothetical protein
MSPIAEARRRRAAQIRTTVAATASALFLALFGALYAHASDDDAAATPTSLVQSETASDASSVTTSTELAPMTTRQS